MITPNRREVKQFVLQMCISYKFFNIVFIIRLFTF
nr:MAG TPA: hypothetical protein [Caudoviricetes sp.]